MNGYKDRQSVLASVQGWNGRGTLSVIGIPGGKFRVTLNALLKMAECTEAQKQAALAVLRAFGSNCVKITGDVTESGIVPDRAEVMLPR